MGPARIPIITYDYVSVGGDQDRPVKITGLKNASRGDERGAIDAYVISLPAGVLPREKRDTERPDFNAVLRTLKQWFSDESPALRFKVTWQDPAHYPWQRQ